MKKDQEQSGGALVPSESCALTGKSNGLVRRGLDDLLSESAGAKPVELSRLVGLEQSAETEEARIAAIVSLRGIGPLNEEVEHALVLALSDESAYVRFLAAEALSKQGRQAKRAIPILTEALGHSGDPEGRHGEYVKDWKRVAAGALGNYGNDAEKAIPALVRTMSNADYNVRGYAAMSLGRIGVPSQLALRGLEQAMAIEQIENVKSIMLESLDRLRGR